MVMAHVLQSTWLLLLMISTMPHEATLNNIWQQQSKADI
jgi:hypothetical protein